MIDETGTTLAGPRPEPIRFFGTTRVDHDGGYPARRGRNRNRNRRPPTRRPWRAA
ncbi:hypothetical protein [Streptomyces sp. 2A115]|uniref:hypothetical protein n=1 Tax=Streptomyces sp. 2A115 TaxID=3457439 RepID=UPI003FD41FD5